MDLQRIETNLRAEYCECAARYRLNDDIEVNTDHHCWLWQRLANLTASFGREIAVLDAGCGTGRYFHCLTNVRRLVGIDLSPEMLEEARHPVREERVSASEIELVCANMHAASFPPGSFDFIYSLGVFGYGCALTSELLDRWYDWLSDDGLVFFDVADVAQLRFAERMRYRLREAVYSSMPRSARRRMDDRGLRMHAFSRKELEPVVRRTRFERVQISPREVRSACWDDRKLECVARKAGRA
jgi:SAM-dependent methyltransferase